MMASVVTSVYAASMLIGIVYAGVGPQECVSVPAATSTDCHLDGQYTCIASFEYDNLHLFGYCQANATTAGWNCCRLPVSEVPEPAPVRVVKEYPAAAATPRKQPNIVLILTDDQDRRLGSLDVMNYTRGLFMNGGASFTNYFVTTPICCPSRVSLLSGRYAHNTGAISGTPPGWCAVGKYWKGPMQNHSLPTYIQSAGYRTGLFGKELNVNDDTYISPGWNRSFALGGTSEGHYYSDWFNDQGKRYTATDNQYMTDLIKENAMQFIKDSVQQNQSFFAYIAPHAPHTRATPQPGTDSYFQDVKAPRFPTWNSSNEDKHFMVRTQAPMDEKCALASDSLYQNRLRALLGVDDLVDDVAQLLIGLGEFEQTYFLYTSDHGFHLGEFRMPYFKAQPYDTDINVPFMIRGPGIKPGQIRDEIALNIDIAPTIAELAGTVPPPEALVDGKSIVSLVRDSTQEESNGWRDSMLFEFWAGGQHGGPCTPGPYCHHNIMCPNNTYAGIRTADGYKYVEFDDDENFKEFYNLNTDPYEQTNMINDTESKGKIEQLATQLATTRECKQANCP